VTPTQSILTDNRSDVCGETPTSVPTLQDARTLLIAINPANPYYARSLRPMSTSRTAFAQRVAVHDPAVQLSTRGRCSRVRREGSRIESGVMYHVNFAMGSVRETLRPSGNLDQTSARLRSLSQSVTYRRRLCPTERAAPSTAASLTGPRCF